MEGFLDNREQLNDINAVDLAIDPSGECIHSVASIEMTLNEILTEGKYTI